MGVINWIVLALMIVCLVEIVIELRGRRYWAAAVTALILAFLIFMWRPMLLFLWKKIVP